MMTRSIVTLSAAALLVGCSVLPESEPATLYRLPPSVVQTPVVNPALAERRLGVASPEARHLLSSDRIVVYLDRNRVNVYADARWHEDAPALVQTRLVEALGQIGLFESVGVDRLPADLVLLSELRQFQSEYDRTPPLARVQLDVQLADGQRHALANRTFTAEARATSEEITDVVDAFGVASDALAAELIAWLGGLTAQVLDGSTER